VQDVAFVELHVTVEEPPELTLEGSADMETVGSPGVTVVTVTFAVLVTEPPAPEHVSE